jgi:5-(hydroxymethyl)furfural/furfural oxidase
MSFIAGLFDEAPLKLVTRSPFGARLSQRSREANAVNMKNYLVMGAAGMLLDGPAPLRDGLIKNKITEGPDLPTMLGDESLLEDFVRGTAMGIKHLSCTCRMGSDDDKMAVTRSDGAVRGIGALRVVDASVMPSLPRCNTNITTLMIAEKMADKILSA